LRSASSCQARRRSLLLDSPNPIRLTSPVGFSCLIRLRYITESMACKRRVAGRPWQQDRLGELATGGDWQPLRGRLEPIAPWSRLCQRNPPERHSACPTHRPPQNEKEVVLFISLVSSNARKMFDGYTWLPIATHQTSLVGVCSMALATGSFLLTKSALRNAKWDTDASSWGQWSWDPTNAKIVTCMC
jgi:hypothetical protein